MIYNVVLFSGVYLSESIIFIHVSTLFFFFFGRFFPHIGHSTLLSTFPSDIQQVFIGYHHIVKCIGFPGVSQMALLVKNPFANTGDVRDMGLIPGSGRSPGEGHDNPLQYSCLENPMDRGTWTVHRVTESQTRLK